jgi:hypothetical protein
VLESLSSAFLYGAVLCAYYFIFMMMSTASKKSSDDTTMMCCASCGIAAVDDVKLKDCNVGCDLVKYCSNVCQNNHRDQHEEECMKRLAELRDRDLFTQPDGSHLGECPICFLPLPIDMSKTMFMECCSKTICKGCNHANQVREMAEGLEPRCAFCREPAPKSRDESNKRLMKRIKKNDPAAMRFVGNQRSRKGDVQTALEYWTKAAELGDAIAHYNLSLLYNQGQGVEKDMKKAVHHLEEAAMKGHPYARHNLGCTDAMNGRFERARKHFIIAANLGCNDSLKCLRQLHADGHASKGDYAGALRGYQAAVDATKSEEREKAEKATWRRVHD